MTNPTNTADQIARSHFNTAARRALAKCGVRIVGLQFLPGPCGGETGYIVDDNGTGRIWTYAQTCAAAGKPMRHAPSRPTMTHPPAA